ncbi:MAG: beta-1,6-N-acetylglucosaminyltransferase [Bacilli bacterium]
MHKQAYLIMSHKNIDHIVEYARDNVDKNFYIHFDLKVKEYDSFENDFDNIFFIPNRVDVRWAGFSMVAATLNLFKFALGHDIGNEYFHLMSGEDVILKNDITWDTNRIYMECHPSIHHQYRMRYNVPHADTKQQRSIVGKFLTQFYKNIDKLVPTKNVYYFGSQWFSIRRKELEILINSISESDLNFFRKKLCPDEHFFQYLVKKNGLLDRISSEGNKRYIIFNPDFQRGSSPIFLEYKELEEAHESHYWFARKVDVSIMRKFYKLYHKGE